MRNNTYSIAVAFSCIIYFTLFWFVYRTNRNLWLRAFFPFSFKSFIVIDNDDGSGDGSDTGIFSLYHFKMEWKHSRLIKCVTVHIWAVIHSWTVCAPRRATFTIYFSYIFIYVYLYISITHFTVTKRRDESRKNTHHTIAK